MKFLQSQKIQIKMCIKIHSNINLFPEILQIYKQNYQIIHTTMTEYDDFISYTIIIPKKNKNITDKTVSHLPLSNTQSQLSIKRETKKKKSEIKPYKF